MKFAVAVFNFFDNENVVYIVEAVTPEEAIIEAVRFTGGDEFADGLRGIPADDMLQCLFDCDMCVSAPVELLFPTA